MTDNTHYNTAAHMMTVFPDEKALKKAQVYATLAVAHELRAIRELLEKRFDYEISDAA